MQLAQSCCLAVADCQHLHSYLPMLHYSLCHADGQSLLLGSSGLAVWDSVTQQRLYKYPGHVVRLSQHLHTVDTMSSMSYRWCCMRIVGKVSCTGYRMMQSMGCSLCCVLLCTQGCVTCSPLTVCATAADSCRCISLQPRWSVCTFQQSRGTSCSCLESNRQSQQEDQTCCSLAVHGAASRAAGCSCCFQHHCQDQLFQCTGCLHSRQGVRLAV